MRWPSAEGARAEGGAVTAELAVALLGLTGVLAGVLSLGTVVQAQLRVHDAAAAGARLAARGEPLPAVREVAGRLSGAGTRVRVGGGGAGTTRVTVTRTVTLLLPGTPAVRVSGHAEAVSESTESEP